MQPAEEGTGELLVCGADLAEALPVQRGAPQQRLPLRGTPHWAELAGPFHHHPAQSLVVTVKKRGFSGGSAVKNPPANAGDVGSIPGSGRSPGEGNGSPLQDSCLGNPKDREALQATVHGVTKTGTRLRDQHFHLQVVRIVVPKKIMSYFLCQAVCDSWNVL